MQQFPCPWCGLRGDGEFRYGGDAGKRRPESKVSAEQWAHYRFYRTNGKGRTRELWLHADGCGRWLEIERDTVSHDVIHARPLNP